MFEVRSRASGVILDDAVGDVDESLSPR